jgi:hypothetical protein
VYVLQIISYGFRAIPRQLTAGNRIRPNPLSSY